MPCTRCCLKVEQPRIRNQTRGDLLPCVVMAQVVAKRLHGALECVVESGPGECKAHAVLDSRKQDGLRHLELAQNLLDEVQPRTADHEQPRDALDDVIVQIADETLRGVSAQIVQIEEGDLGCNRGSFILLDVGLVRAKAHVQRNRIHDVRQNTHEVQSHRDRHAELGDVRDYGCRGTQTSHQRRCACEPCRRAQRRRHFGSEGEGIPCILQRTDGGHVDVAYFGHRRRDLTAGGERIGTLRSRSGSLAELRKSVCIQRGLEKRRQLLAALAAQNRLQLGAGGLELLGCGVGSAEHDGGVIRREPPVLGHEVCPRRLLAGDDLGQLLEKRQHVLLRANRRRDRGLQQKPRPIHYRPIDLDHHFDLDTRAERR